MLRPRSCVVEKHPSSARLQVDKYKAHRIVGKGLHSCVQVWYPRAVGNQLSKIRPATHAVIHIRCTWLPFRRGTFKRLGYPVALMKNGPACKRGKAKKIPETGVNEAGRAAKSRKRGVETRSSSSDGNNPNANRTTKRPCSNGVAFVERKRRGVELAGEHHALAARKCRFASNSDEPNRAQRTQRAIDNGKAT